MRNSNFPTGAWGPEERSDNPLSKGKTFKVEIKVLEDRFHVRRSIRVQQSLLSIQPTYSSMFFSMILILFRSNLTATTIYVTTSIVSLLAVLMLSILEETFALNRSRLRIKQINSLEPGFVFITQFLFNANNKYNTTNSNTPIHLRKLLFWILLLYSDIKLDHNKF